MTRFSTFARTALFAALAAACLAAAATAQAQDAKPLGSEAVWNFPDPDRGLMAGYRACLEATKGEGNCLEEAMRQGGASPQAVEAARLLGFEAFVSKTDPGEPLGLAEVSYPARANTNSVLFVTGGEPPLVTTELPQDAVALARDPRYPEILKRFPKADFLGTRAGFAECRQTPGGGARMVFNYPLLNGCHACEQAGTAVIALEFGPGLHYLGPRLIKLIPAP